MILIFKSQITKAVYSWNGKEVVTIIGNIDRPVGILMKGFDNSFLLNVFNKRYNPPRNHYGYFQVGEAEYEIIERLVL